jgi:exodeoxyribonuclease X
MQTFVVIDFETTHREPTDAHIVEAAAVFVKDGRLDSSHSFLVKPPISIPPETSAVHHIIDQDVANALPWEQAQVALVNALQAPDVIAVAHNADFERTFIDPLVQVPWICTYKGACRVFRDAPGHSNEVLRYYLGFGTGRSAEQHPHSALHDALVTAQLLIAMLEKGTTVENLVAWQKHPAMIPFCPIGDYRGMRWENVPADFLEWICHKARNMRPDLIFCAGTELNRRSEERAKLRAQREAEATKAEESDEVPF